MTVNRSAALPFVLKRGSDVFSGDGFTSTRETVHGLLRLEGGQLRIQWRVGTKTERFGDDMSVTSDVGRVHETVVPLARVAGASVRRRWWDWLMGPRIVLTAGDLAAFEELAGPDGLRLDHPAELVLRLRRSDGLAGEEFSAELELALAERALGGGSGESLPDAATPRLEPPTPPDSSR